MAILSYDEAAHLYRRMGFGGSPQEIEDLVARGREGAVDYMLNFDRIDNQAVEDLLSRTFNFSDPNSGANFNQAEIRRWWFARMVLSKRQFEEKITLFWHNHFATGASKTGELTIFVQNQTIRKFALDRFDNLLLKISQDPAMLIWLDGIVNVRGRANENFAREINELFTSGINDAVTGEPNYTEDDIKEIARAFTGWKFRRPNARAEPFNLQFFVNPSEHDTGSKTIFGQTANFSGEDVVTLLAAKRATARYLVKKLFHFFVFELTDSQADKGTIDKFADVYMNNNHSIKELLRAVFTSDEFFSQRAIFGLVKSPAEYVVGAVRMLGAQYIAGAGTRKDSTLYLASRAMGMDVFEPPDVSGWELNLGWINTASALNRFNFANQLLTNRNNAEAPGALLTIDHLRGFAKANHKKTVKRLLSVLGPLVVDSDTIRVLRDYLRKNDRGDFVEPVIDDTFIDTKIRGLIHQALSLPESQLN